VALISAGAFDDEALSFKVTGEGIERVIDETEDSSCSVPSEAMAALKGAEVEAGLASPPDISPATSFWPKDVSSRREDSRAGVDEV
jgi:hypothetical protein